MTCCLHFSRSSQTDVYRLKRSSVCSCMPSMTALRSERRRLSAVSPAGCGCGGGARRSPGFDSSMTLLPSLAWPLPAKAEEFPNATESLDFLRAAEPARMLLSVFGDDTLPPIFSTEESRKKFPDASLLLGASEQDRHCLPSTADDALRSAPPARTLLPALAREGPRAPVPGRRKLTPLFKVMMLF